MKFFGNPWMVVALDVIILLFGSLYLIRNGMREVTVDYMWLTFLLVFMIGFIVDINRLIKYVQNKV